MLSKGAVRRLKAAMNRRNAVRLRLEGKSYAEIAKTLNIGKESVRNYIVNSLKDMKENEQEDAAQLRTLQTARYERMLAICWKSIEANNDGPSIDRAVRIMNDENKLYPVAAPIESKVKVTEELSYNQMIETLANGGSESGSESGSDIIDNNNNKTENNDNDNDRLEKQKQNNKTKKTKKMESTKKKK